MGEIRYRLDVLEATDDTRPLSDTMADLRERYEELNQRSTRSATALIEKNLAIRLNEYDPFVYLVGVHFDLEELNELANSVGVDMEHVPDRGTTVKSQARALVEYMTRRNAADALIEKAAKARPKVDDLQALVRKDDTHN